MNRKPLVQVGRALGKLRIQMISAHAPLAHGGSERNLRSGHGWLPQELHVRVNRKSKEANRFLSKDDFAGCNEKFRVSAVQPGSAFVRLRGQDLKRFFSVFQERAVNRGNSVQIGNHMWQIEKLPSRNTLAGCRVIVYEHLDGTLKHWSRSLTGPNSCSTASKGVSISCGYVRDHSCLVGREPTLFADGGA